MTIKVRKTNGRSARDEAMEQVERGAESDDPGWRDRAYDQLLQFIQTQGKVFSSEDVRAYAAQQGLTEPRDPRAWGPVFFRAMEDWVISFAGMSEAGNAQAHCRPIHLWRRCRPTLKAQLAVIKKQWVTRQINHDEAINRVALAMMKDVGLFLE